MTMRQARNIYRQEKGWLLGSFRTWARRMVAGRPDLGRMATGKLARICGVR